MAAGISVELLCNHAPEQVRAARRLCQLMLPRCDELMPVTRLPESLPRPSFFAQSPAAARGATTRPVLTTDHGFFLVPHPEMDIGANGEVGDRPRVRQPTTVRERTQARHNRPFVTFPSDCEMSFSQLSCLPPLTFRHPRRRHHVPKALVGASRHPFHPPPPQTPPTRAPHAIHT